MAASAPSRASPAGLACPCARPTTVSPGAHSSDTSQVTRPEGDRAREKPANRRRSRRGATELSERASDGAPSLDIEGISVRGLKNPRTRSERLRPVGGLRAKSQNATNVHLSSARCVVSLWPYIPRRDATSYRDGAHYRSLF